MLTSYDVRKLFLNYFVKNNHQQLESASLIPHNDDTLLFTNAGMVPFKNIFMGLDDTKFKKVTSVQKCLRAGGKHNDLDNVGYTARHHTFFEMLGNFSFGDYFKEEAIFYAWDFLTKELALPQDKLLVTIYNEDEEAANLWKKVAGLPDSRILRIKGSDNFWEMADVGPCGPCTEIFYDRGSEVAGGLPGSPDEGDRFMEVWNLVFMQFERLADGSMVKLKKPCIDTGMGLERIVSVIQGKADNYEIDLFKNIMNATADILKVKQTDHNINAFKVVADHIRASSFLIAEGILPSNEGRGYVLRRILRRAVRYLYLLGVKDPSLYKLVVPLKKEMGASYKELVLRETLIKETIQQEEEKFSTTFSKGLKILNDQVATNPKADLSGDFAFKLYDTYGFPLDLTKDVLKSQKINVDEIGFNAAFTKHKQLAKESWKGSGEIVEEEVWLQLAKNITPSKTTNNTILESTSILQAIIMPNSNDLQPQLTIKDDEEQLCYLVFKETPFYYEKGGQVADMGFIRDKTNTNCIGKIIDVQKRADSLLVHKCLLAQGTLNVGNEYILEVDTATRKATAANHSAAHLLHSALVKYVGHHVVQKGSFLNEQRLRFDFFHQKPLTKEEIHLVEMSINKTILQNLPITIKEMALEDALKHNATALFGEKYPKTVTTVKIGSEADELYSFELCGGTHVQQTGEIGMFKIISESSIASGVRRVEGITGLNVAKHLDQLSHSVKGISNLLHTDSHSLEEKVQFLLESNRQLVKKYQNLLNKHQGILLKENIKNINGLNTLCFQIQDMELKDIRSLVNTLPMIKDTVMLLYVMKDDKAAFLLSVPAQYAKVLSAEFNQHFLQILEGSGGGNAGNFQGRGNPKKIAEAFQYLLTALQ